MLYFAHPQIYYQWKDTLLNFSAVPFAFECASSKRNSHPSTVHSFSPQRPRVCRIFIFFYFYFFNKDSELMTSLPSREDILSTQKRILNLSNTATFSGPKQSLLYNFSKSDARMLAVRTER